MNHIAQAVTLLHQGKLVAFPTETVYGLGADASNAAAVQRIFTAKQRPFAHPLIVHIADINQLSQWACNVSPQAMRLAQAFWPGPLTLILQKQPHVLDIVTGSQQTVGLRVPRHPMAQALLQAFGGGIAAPSANQFTHLSPTTAAAVQAELHEAVDLILDGGDCEIGLESTIIDMSGTRPVILRPGMLNRETIASVLDEEILTRDSKNNIRVPGMHAVHYAPITPSQLMAVADIPAFIAALTPAQLPVALLLHSDLSLAANIHCIKMSNNAVDYAHNLYQTLRALDQQGLQRIIIETVPDHPEWEAIRDRLLKATQR